MPVTFPEHMKTPQCRRLRFYNRLVSRLMSMTSTDELDGLVGEIVKSIDIPTSEEDRILCEGIVLPDNIGYLPSYPSDEFLESLRGG